MSQIKILFLLFSALSSQTVFCNELDPMTVSTIFTTDIEAKKQQLQQPNLTPGAKKAVTKQILVTAQQYQEYRQKKAAQKKMREEYIKQIPEIVRKNYISVFKEITPDLTKKLKKLTKEDADLTSTNGVRDEERLATAKKHYRDMQQAQQTFIMHMLMSSLELIPQNFDPMHTAIEVKRNVDPDGIITYEKIPAHNTAKKPKVVRVVSADGKITYKKAPVK